jgi:hypothetical protein
LLFIALDETSSDMMVMQNYNESKTSFIFASECFLIPCPMSENIYVRFSKCILYYFAPSVGLDNNSLLMQISVSKATKSTDIRKSNVCIRKV